MGGLGKESAEHVWTTAQRLGTFTYRQLSAEAGRDEKGVQRLVLGWEKAGKVVRLPVTGRRVEFRVADQTSGEVPPPRRQSVEGNIWNTMRRMSAFSPVDLAAMGTTDTVTVDMEVAAGYCRKLAEAGYLRVLKKAVPGKRHAVYRLIKDTGPRPPRKMRVTVVYDDNLGQVTHVPQEVAS